MVVSTAWMCTCACWVLSVEISKKGGTIVRRPSHWGRGTQRVQGTRCSNRTSTRAAAVGKGGEGKAASA